MIYRSLHEDQKVITLGEALFLINYRCEKLSSSITTRIDFQVTWEDMFFSLEGNDKEIALVEQMYKLYGPTMSLELLRETPSNYSDLRDNKTNALAQKQAIASVLFLNFSKMIWPSPEKSGFKKWVKQYDPYNNTVTTKVLTLSN
jgi:hypothetical protein